MAVDEAILEAVGTQGMTPTLRLYAWQPACLSLGYAQTVEDVDIDRLTQQGWGLVRRPTGGQAILHIDELTYAIIGPAEHPILVGGVLESYQRIAKALQLALLRLGLHTQALPSAIDPKSPKGPVCFEVPSNYEITVNGKKIVGSAQARKKWGVLQHGSLPLYGDLERITEVLHFDNETERSIAAQRLKMRATTVEEITGKKASWEQAAQAFRAAFEETLRMRLEESTLTEWETQRARELVEEKYANPSWTQHKMV